MSDGTPNAVSTPNPVSNTGGSHKEAQGTQGGDTGERKPDTGKGHEEAQGTQRKAWYQSRTILAALAIIVVQCLEKAGISVGDEELTDLLVSFASIVGAIVAIDGRKNARQPIVQIVIAGLLLTMCSGCAFRIPAGTTVSISGEYAGVTGSIGITGKQRNSPAREDTRPTPGGFAK